MSLSPTPFGSRVAVPGKLNVASILNDAPVPPREERGYIGASSIGKECNAYQALTLRGFPKKPLKSRVIRIFRDGHRIEPQVIEDLKNAGFEVHEIDPNTKRQWQAALYGGHVKANLDGVILSDPDRKDTNSGWSLLEIKSMNESRFVDFARRGLLATNPEYYDQVQFGMGMAGLMNALVVAYCKNNGEYTSEWIAFDSARYMTLLARAAAGMQQNVERVMKYGVWENDSMCMWCDFRPVCHKKKTEQDVTVTPMCATCAHSMADPINEGQLWLCMKHGGSNKRTHLCDSYEVWRPK